MFADEFRTDMEEVEAERLVSEATAADAPHGSGSALVSSPRAGLDPLCRTQCPRGRGEAGRRRAERGPLQSPVGEPPLPWTRRRCSEQPQRRAPGRRWRRPRLQGWGSVRLP